MNDYFPLNMHRTSQCIVEFSYSFSEKVIRITPKRVNYLKIETFTISPTAA